MHEMKESALNFVRTDVTVGTSTKNLGGTIPTCSKKFNIILAIVFALEGIEAFSIITFIPHLEQAIKTGSDKDMFHYRVLLYLTNTPCMASI